MSERDQVQDDLGGAGVLNGLRWARGSAYSRTLSDYDPDTGYDQACLGTLAYKLMVDRLDRVFSCGKYGVDSPGEVGVGLDVVGAGLLPGELAAMPTFVPGTVERDDLNGSPGWRCGDWRWLLASCPFGTWRNIPWFKKSATKQRVARQAAPGQLTLTPDVLDLPEVVDALADLAAPGEPRPTTTLILVHAAEVETGAAQLLLGRPRMDDRGAEAWWWTLDLLSDLPGAAGRQPSAPTGPDGPGANDVPDAPVRLRRGRTDRQMAGDGDSA
ncbi:MAG: hypothetical protein M3P96_01860 [Actinomycetota bacterium]|nr:hypothetical protein [Actinomycetota bacterium]